MPSRRLTTSLALLLLCAAAQGGGTRALAHDQPLVPAPVPAGWLAQAQAGLERREYEASPGARGLQAPNRAHNLRTYFEPHGVRLVDRTAPGEPELLRLTLTSVGRPGRSEPVPPGDVTAAPGRAERVEIRREGLVEWYENGPEGLEQGFTLEQRPAGEGELRLALRVDSARARFDGSGLVLVSGSGRVLRYDGLSVRDARGTAVPARLTLPEPERIEIALDDRAAAYPLVIDPILTGVSDATIQSNQAAGFMGSVAGAGDVNGDGYADVIVGASFYDLGEVNEGAAFVFLGGPAGLASGSPATASATIQSNQGAAFLGAVAGAGDVNGDGYDDVIVTASRYDSGQNDEGAAFVFLGGPAGIPNGSPATASATIQSNQADALLEAAAGAGDVNGDGYADVIVGAYSYDSGEANEGAAFVFLGGPAGIANGNPATASATIQSNQAGAFLGLSVNGAGDVNGDGYADVIVDASGYDSGELEEGAAFLFLGGPAGVASGNPATANTVLQANQAGARMGYSVASAGDVNGDGFGDVIVGAQVYDSGELDEGAAFVFLGSPAGVPSGGPANASATLQGNQASAFLGSSVASAGDVNGDGYADVLVGGHGYDSGELDEGAAFVFLGNATGVASAGPTGAYATLQVNQAGAQLGANVASADDVNGDGHADLIVGAFSYDAGETDEGAAFLFLGAGSGVGNTSVFSVSIPVLQSNQDNARFGYSVAGAGDVNADGYADVIVGATDYDAGEADEGAAFVFLGGPAGVLAGDPTTASAILQSNQVDCDFGFSVDGAGDVNGDGYADVIVGASLYNAGVLAEGAAFVYLGGPAGVPSGNPATANAVVHSTQFGGNLGFSVAGAGDVNGDGFADVIIGCVECAVSAQDEGMAFVFLGSPAGITGGTPAAAAASLRSGQFMAKLGWSVSGAGDVNADGYSDVIVGSMFYDSGQTDEGAAFVFLGGPLGVQSGTVASAAATIQSDQADAWMGNAVAGAGDVNGDGYADVLVGAFQYDTSLQNAGTAYVYLGGPAGIASGNPTSASATLQGDIANSALGDSLAGVGDVNADGFADVAVTHNFGALVYHGGPAGIAGGLPAAADGVLALTGGGPNVAGAGDVNADGFSDLIVGVPFINFPQPIEGAAFIVRGNRQRNGRAVLARQLRAGSGTPVQAFGVSQAGDAFQLRMRATDPRGRRFLALDSEACPAGSNWGSASCSRKRSPWVEGLSGIASLSESHSGLAADRLYRWRARVLHGPARLAAGVTPPPNPPHGPWRRLDGQAREADIRTSSVANLSVDMLDAPDPVVAGQTLRYTLAVANSGPSAGKNLKVVQTLPLGLTFLGASGAGWSCAQVLQTVSCTRGRLEAQSGAPIFVDVQAPSSGSLYSSASVSGSSIDPFAFDDFDDETTGVTPLADLSITKTNGETQLVPGAPVTYTLMVANAGPANALGVAVSDPLPGSLVGAAWTCVASSGSSCPASGSGSIAHSVSVLSGGTLTYTLNATIAVSATGLLTNVASLAVPAGLHDPVAGNNTAQDSDPLTTDADLGVSVSDGLATATPGLPITYTLTVTNAGPPAANGATVASAIPSALQAASWTCAASAGSICTPGPVSGNVADTVNLLSGGTLTYTLHATVKPGATGSLTQQAGVTPSPGHSDPSLGNNNASDIDTLVPVTDLALSVTDAPDPLPVFGAVSYALEVQNDGPSDATGVTLVQALPAGLTFSSASPGCANAAGNVTCVLGGLPSGQSRSLTVEASAAPGTIGTLAVSAAVTGGESDPDGANNAAAQTTTVAFLKGDLDNDLQTDLLLRNVDSGINVLWLLNGVTRRSSALITPDPQGLDWQVVGVDDFDGDHRNDLVLRDGVTGATEFWLMGGASGSDRQGAAVPLSGGSQQPPWALSATADFNHDGHPDLVWRNFATQKIEIWTMDGTTRTGTIVPTPDQAVDLHWEIVGAQDWNADGHTDFLWYNPDSGKIVLWFMDATVVRITGQFTNPTNAGDNNWKVLAMGDYGTGPGGLPGTRDIVWRNATSGNFVVWFMDAAGNRTFGTFTTPVAPPNPLSYTIVGPR